MLSFCKRNLLNSSFSSSCSEDHHHRIRYRNFNSMDSGLSLIVGDFRRPENVLESASVKPIASIRGKKVSISGGFCCGGSGIGTGMDGLSSCTESLGFESSDHMEKDVEDDDDRMIEAMRSSRSNVESRWRRLRVDRIRRRDELLKMKMKKDFPPPLSSLNRNGQPNFFLKPVRKDGRLELIEVWINRPEIFRASRQDGRLRLNLFLPESVPEHLEHEEEEEEEIEEEEQEQEQEKIAESNVREMKLPLTSSGEGFRRCHELSNRHLHMWNRHEVTTRSTVHVL